MHASAKITESTLHAAADYAAEFLRGLDGRPVNATSDVESLRQLLDFPMTADGMAPSEVISKLVQAVDGGLLGMQSGRFFGWVIGGALPSALAADWLTSAWGQNSALFASSPAASVVEEVAGPFNARSHKSTPGRSKIRAQYSGTPGSIESKIVMAYGGPSWDRTRDLMLIKHAL